MEEVIKFLNNLEDKKIYYRLNKIRDDSIMIEISVPGQRWEVEFMENGNIEIEKFFSNGTIFGKEELETLFRSFSD